MRTPALLLVVALAVVGCAGPRATASPSPPVTPGTTSTPASTATPVPTLSPGAIAAIGELRATTTRLPIDAASEAERAALVASDTDFALRLFLAVTANETDDVFLSPYSISTALSMAYAGARAQTAEQMAQVLGIDLADPAWHAARNRLELEMLAAAAQPIKTGDRLTLDPTNAVFGQSGFPFEDEYLQTLAEAYGAGLQTLDFAADPDAARRAINAWVAERTRDRIEELLPEDSISDLTRCVLVNAIYFKASWVRPFHPSQTEPRPFHLLDGSQVDVPTMRQSIETTYADGDGWAAVRLPYHGASMLLVLPDAGRFADVEQRLSGEFLADVKQAMRAADVDLDLPKWESESAITLNRVLLEMGMVDIFDPDLADLSGITPVADLYVSSVVHQANVTVDEEGTEAAAATAVIADVTSAGPPPVRLAVDRPFIYLIQDDISGEILFMGRLLTP